MQNIFYPLYSYMCVQVEILQNDTADARERE
jgi:hypothetical protein